MSLFYFLKTYDLIFISFKLIKTEKIKLWIKFL